MREKEMESPIHLTYTLLLVHSFIITVHAQHRMLLLW